MPWRCLWPVGPDLPWMLSVGGDGAVGGCLPWSERPLREVPLASCGATAETCPMLSPARASLHVINTPNNNNKILLEGFKITAINWVAAR